MERGAGYNVTVFPAIETRMNGVPESQANLILIKSVLVGPIFSSYDPNGYVTEKKFKPIVQFEHDHTRNTEPYTMSVSVQNSTSQGSEWEGAVQFSTDVKLGIIGKVNATAGVTHKQVRSTNEAVGTSGSLTVAPRKTGYIKFWYKGQTTGGILRTYTYNTENPYKKYYLETPIKATLYRSNYLDVFSESWQS